MKIVYENVDKEKLQEMKNLIEEILDTDFEDVELTEENLKKAESIKNKANKVCSYNYRIKPIQIKIVSSVGAELTM